MGTDGKTSRESAQRSAERYVILSQQARSELKGPNRAEWLDRLERELDGIRAALAWLTEQKGADRAEQALQLVGDLREFWWERDRLGEGRYWLMRLLALPQIAGRTELRARALDDAAVIAFYQEDYDVACSLLVESIGIWRQLEGAEYVVYSLIHLGHALRLGKGDLAGARSAYDETLAAARSLGFSRGIGYALAELGRLALQQGDRSAARVYLEQGMAILRELGDVWAISFVLEAFAVLAAVEKRERRSVCLAGAAAALQETLAVSGMPAEQEWTRAVLEGARRVLPESDVRGAEARGRAMTWEQVVRYALGEDFEAD